MEMRSYADEVVVVGLKAVQRPDACWEASHTMIQVSGKSKCKGPEVRRSLAR